MNLEEFSQISLKIEELGKLWGLTYWLRQIMMAEYVALIGLPEQKRAGVQLLFSNNHFVPQSQAMLSRHLLSTELLVPISELSISLIVGSYLSSLTLVMLNQE